jgi:anti-sigma-K factor RskA
VHHDSCARVAALAPAGALGALDPDEAAFLRAHLASCGRPHPELRDAADLAAAIGGAWPDRDLPSPGLRDRLLAAVHETEAPPRPARVAAPVTVRRSWWRPAALGAAALAIAASLLLAVQLGENAALRDRLAAADDRLSAVELQLERAESWIDRAVATGADAYFMDGEGHAAEASFMLVVEADAAGAVLLMSDLPALASDRVYELWVERDGEIVSAGTFRPDDRGIAAVAIDASLVGIRQAMITIEPEGGSPAPADDVIMQGELTL